MADLTERRVIQFAVTGAIEGKQYRERLYALADDGSLWRMDDPDVANGRGVRRNPKRSTAWTRIPALPGRQEAIDTPPDAGSEAGNG